MVIRPPRAKYNPCDLGPERFVIVDQRFKRVDMTLVNDRGMKLQCSHFIPVEIQPDEKFPCVVYIHGNCSSRLEVLPCLKRLLQRRLSVFCMDLSGSGLSDGEYVSLGYHEKQDVRVGIEYLRTCRFVSSIGLWGRSMGAVTAILLASEDPSISACVLDSPFASLRTVAKELVANKKIILPSFLTEVVLQLIRGAVQSRADFDMDTLCPIERAPKAAAPVLFAVASDDTFVMPHHTDKLCSAWGGHDRTIMQVAGNHNTLRPAWFIEVAAGFLEGRLARADSNKAALPDTSSIAVRKLGLERMPLPKPVPVETVPAVDDMVTLCAEA